MNGILETMNDKVNPPTTGKRSYDATQRRKAARDTQRAIVAAARSTFIERGYTATTMAVIAESAGVDTYRGAGGIQHFVAGHEGASAWSDRAQLRNRLAVASHDERLAGSDGGDDPGVVVAQFALRNGPAHRGSVASCATPRYVGGS